MNDMQACNPESDFFRAKVRDRICTLELKNCSMLAAIDLKCRDEMIHYLDSVSKSSTIKGSVALHRTQTDGATFNPPPCLAHADLDSKKRALLPSWPKVP